MSRKPDVIVIGGGISGLSVAWRLKEAGRSVVLLEKEKNVGGTMKTENRDGWLIEHGPNSTLETTPLFGEMFDRLGITEQRVYASSRARKRYILRDGTLHRLPMSPGAFVTSKLWSASAKARLFAEPFVGRCRAEESVAAFVERRLGPEFLEYAINPFVAGVYAGNPEQLSVRYAFPKLHALEERYGGLVLGMILGRAERNNRSETGKNRAQLFSFREGMSVLPRALERALGASVQTGAEVLGVTAAPRNGGRMSFAVRYRQDRSANEIEGSGLVLAAPAYAAAGLVAGLSPALSDALRSLRYPPVGQVFLGFRRDQVGADLDGFGFLVPERERRKILGTIWSSVLFEHRAPAGHVALTTFVGGARRPSMVGRDDQQLIEAVLEDLRPLMKISGRPVFSSITRWKNAIPQYNLGYRTILDSINRFEEEFPGAYICSNYRGGISVGDCVMSADRVARNILGERSHESSGQPVRI